MHFNKSITKAHDTKPCSAYFFGNFFIFFKEVVGLISIEDVLEQIIGMKIVDEFDQYDDLRAVAAQRARDIRESREEETVVE